MAKMSNSQIAELKKAFDSIDTDRNQQLSKSELAGLLVKLNVKVDQKVLDKMFQIADKDGSGFIDFQEFITTMSSACQAPTKDDLLETFKALDKDGSGMLSFQELKSAMRDFNPGMTDSDIRNMIKAADRDQDGQVSYKEFVNMM